MLRDFLLIVSGFLFGVGLMLIDELFIAVAHAPNQSLNLATIDWVGIRTLNIWDSWEIIFIWLVGSVFLMFVIAGWNRR